MAGIAMAISASLAASAGCNNSARGTNWLKVDRPRSNQELVDAALEGKTGDERRKAVTELAQRKEASAAWAVKVFDTIARTDSDAMVRCAAVAGLAKSPGPGHVETAVRILRSQREKFDNCRPATGAVRWEAARLLLETSELAAYDDAQQGEIVSALLEALRQDPERNVRLTVIDALAYHRKREVLEGLIAVVGEEDFAVKRGAEKSLIALTGTTQRYDAEAWTKWLAETPEPFARAGESPTGMQAAGDKSWWGW